MPKPSSGHKRPCDPLLDCQPLDAEPTPLGQILVNGVAHPFYWPGDLLMVLRLAGAEVTCETLDRLPFTQRQGRYDGWRQTPLGRQLWPLPTAKAQPGRRGRPGQPAYVSGPEDFERKVIDAIKVIEQDEPATRTLVSGFLAWDPVTYRRYRKRYTITHEELQRRARGP